MSMMRFPNLTGLDLVSLQGRQQYFYHSKICFTVENKSFKITVLKEKWKKIATIITFEHFNTCLTLFSYVVSLSPYLVLLNNGCRIHGCRNDATFYVAILRFTGCVTFLGHRTRRG